MIRAEILPEEGSSHHPSLGHVVSVQGGSKPKLAVASLSDMVGLNPADIFTKLKVLASERAWA